MEKSLRGNSEAFLQIGSDAPIAPLAGGVRRSRVLAWMMQSFLDIPDAALRGIRTPTLVMAGDADVVTVEHAAQLSRLVPHGQLTVLPGSEHGTYLGVAEAAKPTGPLTAASLALIEAFLDGR
jgi:pimeloyl-ACP methyl ester carboxylesterase